VRESPDHPYFGSEKVAPLERIPDVSPARSFAKAISWRVLGTIDTLVLSFVILTFLAPLFGMEDASNGDNARTATYIAVTEVVTKMVLYYLHERAWSQFRWDVSLDEEGHRKDGLRRSGLKTATWRVSASLDTMILALIFTGNIATAISIGGFEVITKLVLYFFHERAWSKIRWGAAH